MMLVTFLQEGQSNKDRSLQGLKAYLQEKNFKEVLKYLDENQNTQQVIESLLAAEFSELNQKIDILSQTLSSVASGLNGFDQLIPEHKQLSSQALYILKEVKERENGILVLEGNQLAIAPWFSGNLTAPEPRFLKDDIDLLTSYNWITYVGNKTYKITRLGYQAALHL